MMDCTIWTPEAVKGIIESAFIGVGFIVMLWIVRRRG